LAKKWVGKRKKEWKSKGQERDRGSRKLRFECPRGQSSLKEV